MARPIGLVEKPGFARNVVIIVIASPSFLRVNSAKQSEAGERLLHRPDGVGTPRNDQTLFVQGLKSLAYTWAWL